MWLRTNQDTGVSEERFTGVSEERLVKSEEPRVSNDSVVEQNGFATRGENSEEVLCHYDL